MACPAPPAKALVVLADISDPAVLGAARQALQQLATALSLSAAPPASAAPGPAPPRPILGLTNLAAGAAQKPVLQVRCRPGPFVLRDFHAAVARLTTSGGAVSSATAAAALQQLVGVVAQDPACAAAGPSKAVLVLTDRVDFSPDDYGACLEVRPGATAPCNASPWMEVA